MKVSVAWLKKLVPALEKIATAEIVKRLSTSGLEVEQIHPYGHDLSNLKIVSVKNKRPHPQADKLKLVDIFDGKETFQVVCGAPNVPDSDSENYVVWAMPGAHLAHGIHVKPAEIRGILSPGMLCSERELGFSDKHEGLLLLSGYDGVSPGDDFLEKMGLPDEVLELNVPANRPDCLGHLGVARELVALFHDQGATLVFSPVNLKLPASAGQISTIKTNELCPRYDAAVISNVTVKSSPLSIRLQLERLGIRSISNIVDATNLTMLEWGQPLHAFDLSKIEGSSLHVRLAKMGEKLRTLDGQGRILQSEDLVVSDDKKALCLAGVMGGKDSEVDETTKSLLLESAYFLPDSIRKTAKRHKLPTDAGYRFERGTDVNAVADVARSCLQRILALSPHANLEQFIDHYPTNISPQTVILRSKQTNQILGVDIPVQIQINLLTSLGLIVEHKADDLLVTVPTFRQDLRREIDLIEEIGRLYGYDKIPQTFPAFSVQQSLTEQHHVAEKARDLCVSLGFSEIQTLSMVSPSTEKFLGKCDLLSQHAAPIELKNPLREELSVLRTQLYSGLLEACRYNYRQGFANLQLFEVSEIYLSADKTTQEKTLVAGVAMGVHHEWLKPTKQNEWSIFDLKGCVEELLTHLGYQLQPCLSVSNLSGIPVIIEQKANDYFHPGLSAKILRTDTNEVVGEFGEVHPTVKNSFELSGPVFMFELALPERLSENKRFVAPPKFPETRRDLSFFAAANLPVNQVIDCIRQAQEPLLSDIQILDDYRETGKVPNGKKSLLLSLGYRSLERTLKDEEVQTAHQRLLEHLKQHLDIELR